VAQMRVTARAAHFGSGHAVTAVDVLNDIRLVRRVVKARPARARIELRVRSKQQRAAAHAVVSAVVVLVPVLARKCALGAALPRYFVLLRRQLLTPLVVALFDLACVLDHPVSHDYSPSLLTPEYASKQFQ